MRLRTKLTAAFLSIGVPFVLVGLITIANSRILARNIRHAQQIAGELDTISHLQLIVAYLSAVPNDYLSTGDPAEEARYTQAVAQVEATFAELEALPFLTDDEQALLAEARRQVAAMNETARAILALPEPVEDPEGIALLRQLNALATDLSTTTLASWHAIDTAELAEAQQMAQAAERRTNLWLVFGVLAPLLAAALMGTFLARYITRPLHELQVGAGTIAGGQFDHRLDIHTGDEIEQLAQVFNQMGARLGDLYAGLERRVAERTADLAASEARYRMLFDSARDGLYVLDMQGHCIDANPAACQLLGYSRQELLATDIFQVEARARGLDPEGRSQLLDQLQAIWRKGMTGYETQLITKSGELVPIEMVITPLTYQGQEAALGVARDITERLRAQEEIERLSRQNELILNSAGEGIFGLDIQGNHTFVNPAAAGMLGYTAEGLIGQHSHSTWHHSKPDGRPYPGEECPIYAAYKDGIVHRGSDEVFWRKDGTSFPVEYVSTPIRDEQGKLMGAVVTFTDITERVRAEEALKEYSGRLEEMVAERTRELREAQEQLIRRERLAVLGQLAGGVAHELRNPLGVIANAVYFLKMVQPDADSTISEYLDLIDAEVHNAAQIVSDLLDFARIKSVDRCNVAISDLIAQVLERQPPPQGVEVAVQVPSDLPPAFVDPRQIGQVLTNLVANAYQAMPEGGRLVIRAEREEERETRGQGDKEKRSAYPGLPFSLSPHLRVSVSDTGTGIPPENLEKIWEPLFTTKARGIGLGLAISRDLVEANGGRIEVESDGVPGKGSTFTVYLPLAESVTSEQ